MKLFTKIAPALIAISLITAGPAAAYSIVDINASANTAGVTFTVDGNVATLIGHVEDNFDKTTLGNNAAKLAGIDEVRNLLSVSQ